MKYTPGPWRKQGPLIMACGVDITVAKVMPKYHPIKGHEQEAANATIIAACPEMLEALERALPLLKTYSDGAWLDAANLVEKTIAKAKGGAG